MEGLLSHLTGVRVIATTHLSEFISQSNKELKHKRWHKRSRSLYAKRVQKKWDKIHGTKMVPYFMKTADAIYAHPRTIERLKEAIKQRDAVSGNNSILNTRMI